MAKSDVLGLQQIDAVHFHVGNLERSRSYWVDRLDFVEVGRTTDDAARGAGQRSVCVRAGEAMYQLTSPERSDSSSGRYLARHPDGVAEIVFRTADVRTCFTALESRGAAIIHDVVEADTPGGRRKWFSVTTAFGDVVFTFVERDAAAWLPAGMEPVAPAKQGNRFGFGSIDHVTSNFLTLKPLVAWCKQVLGLEEYWGIEFHTRDYATVEGPGSGLKSVVLWDPHSGLKFANNEPLRPFFEHSQIYLFVEDNRGPGVQHTALTIADIVGTVRAMRGAGLAFMPTPQTYYDALPERLDEAGITLDEPIPTLAENEILVDGEGPGKYLLQIFGQDLAHTFGDPSAGPFFVEIIQRKGDRGFGGGNFRALFESIERAQLATGRV